jgi:hypothetical protein
MPPTDQFKVGDRVVCHGQPGTVSEVVMGWYRIRFDTVALGPRISNYWGPWELRLETKVK